MHFGRYGGNFHDGFGFSNDGGFGFSLFNYLPLLFMVGLIVLVIVLIVKQSKHSHAHHHQSPKQQPSNDQAITIVKERYAKGELSKEEYLELIETLKESQ
ncbi:MAG: hypothetical protein ACQER2_06620 [Bacillota bacterium]